VVLGLRVLEFPGGTYGCEQLMVVCVSETAFLRSCDGCAKGGQEDDILRVLLEDVPEAFLDGTCHFEERSCDTWLAKSQY